MFQTTDLPNLVQVESVRRKCQATEYGGFPSALFPFTTKKGEQNYPVYPLGPAEQSVVKGFRLELFPVDLRLILAHPISKQAFLPSPLAFPIAVQIRVKCFPAYQAVFALLLMHFHTSRSPSLSFVPRLG